MLIYKLVNKCLKTDQVCETYVVLIDPDVERALVQEGIVHAKCSRQTGAVGGVRAVDTKLTTTLGDSSVENLRRSRGREK